MPLERTENEPEAVPGFIPALVKTFGQDERTSIEGGRVGPGLDLQVGGGVETLMQLGLAEALLSPFEHLIALTDRGRLLARLLLAPGEPPLAVAPRVYELQRRTRAFEEQANAENDGKEPTDGRTAVKDEDTYVEGTAPTDGAT